ncbi:MAG: 1-acyl-sn-glycerol-3-phosphate acyltransferase [Chitinophagaceae bacterium]|nr:1-acyl-sn-glycerol-3-phosphate acyltransferase [Chitinophagaceae bacterium]
MSKWLTSIKESAFVKKIVYMVIGSLSYPGLNLINRLQVNGMEKLRSLPKSNVMFVSNHQTYFAEVIAMLHIFGAVSWGKKRKLGIPYYLLWPYTRVQFVSAEETMKKNWLSKLFALAGSIMVKRVWVTDAKETRKGLDPSDTRKISRALEKNWIITFPQGTTTPFVPGRKGTAFIIKHQKPVVIPVVVEGFNTAFDKKGLKLLKKGTRLSITFKDPMQIDFEQSTEKILEDIMDAIEQSKKFMPGSNQHENLPQ